MFVQQNAVDIVRAKHSYIHCDTAAMRLLLECTKWWHLAYRLLHNATAQIHACRHPTERSHDGQ